MQVLSGPKVSEARRADIRQRCETLIQMGQRKPGLAVVLIGDDPASQVYVRNKERACESVGFLSKIERYAASIGREKLKRVIERLNKDPEIHGLLVQLPLPQNFSEKEALSWIDPRKDVDGLTIENIGLFMANQPRVVSCTPNGVMAILKHYQIPVVGKRVVVVGRSQIVGQPMAKLLQNANATVTVCHSQTPDISVFTREADIVVVAAGVPRLLGKDDFKKGAVVIDVGIHRLPLDSAGQKSKLCGDVRFEELDGWASAATPVPGGVGPMTITMLLENTLRLAALNQE